MKSLYGIIFLSLTLLFACGEKGNTIMDKSATVDSVSVVMPENSFLHVDTIRLYALRDSSLALYKLSKQQGNIRKPYNTIRNIAFTMILS